MRSLLRFFLSAFAVAAPVLSQTAPLTITTTSLPNGTVQQFYSQSITSTGGVGSARTWSVASGSLPAGLNLTGSTSTATLSGTPTTPGSSSFVVTVSDPQGQIARQQLFLTIQTPPLVITTASPLPSGTTGTNYSYTLTASGGVTPYFWYIYSGTLPPGLSLSTGGTITGTPSSAGVYQFTVGVNDGGFTGALPNAGVYRSAGAVAASDTRAFTMTITAAAPQPLVITTPSPAPNGVIGTPYSLNFVATGGSPPYTFSLAGGNLPNGLTLASNGALTGTPTTAALFTFTVAVTPPGVSTKTFALRITAPITVTTVSPIPATAGSALTVVMQATGGLPPYLWFVASGSALPAGFTLDAGSGFLSGTPAAAGTFNFAVQANDNIGNTSQPKALSLVVAPALAISTASPVPAGSTGANYSLTFAATGGNPSLTWTLESGSLPLGMTLNPSTGVLSGTTQIVGVYTFTIRVTDTVKATITKIFTLAINQGTPQGSPLLSDTNLDFSAFLGGDSPAPKHFSLVSSATAALQFTIQIDGGAAGSPAPAWLSVRLAKGSTPARISVAVDHSGLPMGKYSARILLNITGGGQSIVTVNLTVDSAAQKLDVSPPYLRYSGSPNTAATFEQDLLVRNIGGGGPFTFQMSPFEGSAWLSIINGSGQTGPNAPALVRVIANTQSLPAGPRRGLIHVESSAGSADIPVSLLVRDDGPILGSNVAGVRFEARYRNGYANTRNVSVLNLGQGSVNWRARIITDSPWLSLGAASGSATPAVPSRLPLSVDPGALNPGPYYALVELSDSGAQASPLFLTAVLNVIDEGIPASPDPSPSGLYFIGKTGAPPPAAQTVRVFTSSTTPAAFQASANTPDGASWLSIDPVSGTTTTQGAAEVNVTVNPTNLRPGVYTGDVTFAFSSTLTKTTNITLVVQPATAGVSAEKSRSVAGCTPARLSLTQTGLVNSFAAPAGWPTPLIVRLSDDCGDPVLNGQVVATFSNGDPTLAMKLTAPDSGLYSATWAPGGVAGSVTVTARASAPSLLSTTADISGSVTANKVPVLFPNRVVNNLNGKNGDPLSPGTVAQVFGSALAPSTAEPGVVPLRSDFNGTRVVVGGLDAPLFFLSDGQLNVQIPTELQLNKEYSIVVAANGGLTVPDSILLAALQPGVAVFMGNRLIAQHSDAVGSLVTPASPAAQGENLTVYLVGMGATDTPVASAVGSPAAEPLARVKAQPIVTIGGKEARVLYAGLTPFAVSLYQITMTVPTGIASGDLPVEITQAGVMANTSVLAVK